MRQEEHSALYRALRKALSVNATHSLGEITVAVCLVLFACVAERRLFPHQVIAGSRLLAKLPAAVSEHADLLLWLEIGFGIPLLLWLSGLFNRKR
jgi:hypothetical protein